MTSLNLSELRTKTGAFIKESDFQVIELEYKDWLQGKGFTDNEANAEEFMELWHDEQDILGTIITTTDGNLKFFCPEGTDYENPISTQEFITQMDMNSYHWENMCRRDWRIFKDIADKNIDMKLIDNILKEDVRISYEQIYQLQCAFKGRMAELLK